MFSRNKEENESRLFDERLHPTILTLPCYRLMGAVLEQAVADYRRLYKQQQKGKTWYSYLGAQMSVEYGLAELRRFFEYYCEGTRFNANKLIEQIEQNAYKRISISKLYSGRKSNKNDDYFEEE